VGEAIPIETMLPAPAQGAVGIETLAANAEMRAWLAAIDHPATSACVRAERALLARLGADCRSPVAALAIVEADTIRLRAEILSEDGVEQTGGEIVIAIDQPEQAGELAARLLDQAVPALRALFAG
jgi:hydroxymethylbilane synthase